ncbi:MAG: hypothetical protein GY926_00380 [bacterium]|nr:hypothetical protein [bacterium]
MSKDLGKLQVADASWMRDGRIKKTWQQIAAECDVLVTKPGAHGEVGQVLDRARWRDTLTESPERPVAVWGCFVGVPNPVPVRLSGGTWLSKGGGPTRAPYAWRPMDPMPKPPCAHLTLRFPGTRSESDELVCRDCGVIVRVVELGKLTPGPSHGVTV